MKKMRSVFLVCLCAMFVLGNQMINGQMVKASDVPANPLEKEGWILERNDEFNGNELDSSLWIPSYLEYRTSAERAAADYEFRDGSLVLKITPDKLTYYDNQDMKVSSVQTVQKDYLHKDNLDHNTPTIENYSANKGYFEIRAKTLNKSGYHCAFWTTGIRNEDWQEAEIDIVEQFGSGRKSYFNIHSWDDPNISNKGSTVTFPFDPSDGYHIYALEWDENTVSLYVDNVLTRTHNVSIEYDAVFFLSIYENAGWTGTVNPNDTEPKEFIIDYFRAYKKDTSVSGPSIIEAENIIESGYSVESKSGASNGKVAKAPWKGSGTLATTYSGEEGVYDLEIKYIDENDGASEVTLLIDGQVVESWTLDADDNAYHTKVIENISLSSGTDIQLQANCDDGEHARIDYIKLIEK